MPENSVDFSDLLARCEDEHGEGAGPAIVTASLDDTDDQTVARLAETFKALSDPTRLRLIAALREAEVCVGDLARALGLEQSAVSHQLRLLRALQIVRARKVGRHVYYALDDDHVRGLFAQGIDHVRHQGAEQRE
jgi:DNA-binding transcriptional ArsR family regulator